MADQISGGMYSKLNKNIIYIDGIEELTALTELDLRNNQISDIKPLKKLESFNTWN